MDNETPSEVKGEIAGQKLEIKAGSTQMLVILLAVLLAVVFSVFLYKHDVNTAAQADKQVSAMLALAKAVEDANISTQRKFVVLTYVLTRDEKQRRELNLAKPPELRDMER